MPVMLEMAASAPAPNGDRSTVESLRFQHTPAEHTKPDDGDIEIGTSDDTFRHGMRTGFSFSLGGITAVFLVLLSLFTEYPTDLGDAHVSQYYQYLTGILIMVFVGFGFLMTVLRRYSLSAVGLNFVLSCLMMLGALVCVGWSQTGFGTIQVELQLLVNAAFCAAGGMITFGAVIGFASPTQMVWLLAAKVPIYAVNLYIVANKIQAIDVGGSITVHTFGAFYGLAASYFLSPSSGSCGMDHPKSGSSYASDVTAMIGTTFLWVYWPSFNAALASVPGALVEEQHMVYVICNTLIALLGATIASFIVSAALNDALDMVTVQNATLAGGVAIGAAAAFRCAPAAALGVGLLSGVLSTLGFKYSTPFVQRKFGICDTCGVQNLHGMPGMLGGLISAVFVAIYYDSNTVLMTHDKSTQVVRQIVALAATLGIAIISGLVVGFLVAKVRISAWAKEDNGADELYEDAAVWYEVEKED